MNPTFNPHLAHAEIARRLEQAQARRLAAEFRSPRSRWWKQPQVVRALTRRLPAASAERVLPTTAAAARRA